MVEMHVVRLNVYDPGQVGPSQMLLSYLGFGQHSSGVQVCNHEYTFTSNGIAKMQPLCMPSAKLNTAVGLGRFRGTPADLRAILRAMEPTYAPGSFDATSRNSNHFAADLAARLLGRDGAVPRWVNRSATLALGKSAPRAAPAAPAPPGALTPDARKFRRCISLTPSLPRRRSEAPRVSFDPYVRVEKCAKPTLEERAACWHGADATRRFVADEHARRVAEGLPCDGSLLLAARDAYAGDCDDSDDDGSFGDDGDERAWDEAKADPGEAKTASPFLGFRAPPPSPRVTFIHGHGVGVSPKAMSAALTSIAVSAVAKDAKDVSGFLADEHPIVLAASPKRDEEKIALTPPRRLLLPESAPFYVCG